MKLIKKMRKGFTLIELVVVIAVIAILSAVSVVSYIAITNKAKQSSDEQAVRQMNTILSANSVMDLKSIRDVFAAFEENGIDAENYKPLAKDHYFFWDQDVNQIVYVDKNYTVVFPESMKGQSRDDHSWLSLSGQIQKRDYTNNNGSITISGTAVEAGESLYKLSEDVFAKTVNLDNSAEEKVINLPEKVDLSGAEFNLGAAANLTIKGESAQSPTVIENVLTTKYQALGTSNERKTRQYGTGLVQSVVGDVTFENLVIENVSIGDYDCSMSGIFAGRIGNTEKVNGSTVSKPGHLTVRNCTIRDAYIYGEQKVGSIAGYLNQANSSLTLENVKFERVHVYAEEGVAGGLIGMQESNCTFTCDSLTSTAIKNNSSVELTKVSDRHYYKAPVELTDASNEVVSVFQSASNRVGEQRRQTVDGAPKERCKPGCAVFGWINANESSSTFTTEEKNFNKTADIKVERGLYFDGQPYMVTYKLSPVHF